MNIYMKKNGAQLAVFALEQIGVKYTFGIPGTHTTELYDALEDSEIQPILVTHEAGAAFMADAVSRTSDSIGCMTIVPAAGLTQAMSGIGEAYLDGIPMLVIAGGTRTDSGRSYQLHQFDQMALARPITKGQFQVLKHEDIIPTLYEAYDLAIADEPGPVFVELPVNLQLFSEKVKDLVPYKSNIHVVQPSEDQILQVVDLIKSSKRPMLFVGWGAVDAQKEIVALAEMLGAPVATTLQGKSTFPNSHPLYTSVGVGASSKPSGQWALERHDLMIAIGTRFGEIATGSYGLDQPKNLVHIDINPEVFDKNFKTTIAITSDAKVAVGRIIVALNKVDYQVSGDVKEVGNKLKTENDKYFDSWLKREKGDIVSPGYFFKELKAQLDTNARMVVDDGKHTFLASELFPVDLPRHFISPTDFNCMGYSIPAAIGVKLSNPDQQVVTIVGDGAFLMTCMEITTAADHRLPILYFVFNDGELGQISQFQKIPLNRNTCSVLGSVDFEGVARATGAGYVKISNDLEIKNKITEAIELSRKGVPVITEVVIDYSKKTMLTKGVVKVNLSRFPFREKVRFIARALGRRLG
jgi:acetolactate synthase-1/2/3 large subunit